VKSLVSTMVERRVAMQRQIDATKAQNRLARPPPSTPLTRPARKAMFALPGDHRRHRAGNATPYPS
jgi:hypothetical protein